MVATPGRPPGEHPGGAAAAEDSTHGRFQDTTRPSSIRREAADAARNLPADELAAIADALRAELAHWRGLPDLDDESRAVALHLAGERLAACEAELARREALARAGACRSPNGDAEFATWRALAAEVRRRTDVRELLAVELSWRPARQSDREAAGPCPLCGGRDRCVAWADRAWCRRCGWSADAIAVARLARRCGFRDAVRALAQEAVR